jgi:hypothetical protein
MRASRADYGASPWPGVLRRTKPRYSKAGALISPIGALAFDALARSVS